MDAKQGSARARASPIPQLSLPSVSSGTVPTICCCILVASAISVVMMASPQGMNAFREQYSGPRKLGTDLREGGGGRDWESVPSDEKAGNCERSTGAAGGSQCDLCTDNWLFVLAAGGRTGSTSALSMFSRVPGFELMGEHNGFLRSQMEALEQLKVARDVWIREGAVPAWKHSDADMNSIYCNIQDLVRRILFGSSYGKPSPAVLGFKEIRYTDMKMMPFLATVFPCARFVFTLRELPLNPDVEQQPWVQYEPFERKAQFVKAVHSIFSNTTALLPVESLTVEHYNNILQGMLGVRGCRFSHILHDNANGKYDADQTEDVIEGECDLSHVDFHLDEGTIQENAALWVEMQLSQQHADA